MIIRVRTKCYKDLAFIGIFGGKNTGVEIGLSEVFRDTEYTRNREGTSLKHDLTIIGFACNAPSRAWPMNVNRNLSVPKQALFSDIAGYARTYSNTSLNRIPNQYQQQLVVPITSSTDCAQICTYRDILIDGACLDCIGYEQCGCNSWQGGRGRSPPSAQRQRWDSGCRCDFIGR